MGAPQGRRPCHQGRRRFVALGPVSRKAGRRKKLRPKNYHPAKLPDPCPYSSDTAEILGLPVFSVHRFSKFTFSASVDFTLLFTNLRAALCRNLIKGLQHPLCRRLIGIKPQHLQRVFPSFLHFPFATVASCQVQANAASCRCMLESSLPESDGVPQVPASRFDHGKVSGRI